MIKASLKDDIARRRFLHFAPSAALFSAAHPVTRFDEGLRELVSEMYRIMYEERGRGAGGAAGGGVDARCGDRSTRAFFAQRKKKRRAKQGEEKEPLEAEATKEAAAEEAEDDCLEAREPFAMVNPEIVRFGEDRRVYEEGCLSFPDLLVEVERPREVEVRYWNVEGVERRVRARGLLSVCLQHEIDHLEGRTIVDSLSRLKRSMVLRRFAKQTRQAQL